MKVPFLGKDTFKTTSSDRQSEVMTVTRRRQEVNLKKSHATRQRENTHKVTGESTKRTTEELRHRSHSLIYTWLTDIFSPPALN